MNWWVSLLPVGSLLFASHYEICRSTYQWVVKFTTSQLAIGRELTEGLYIFNSTHSLIALEGSPTLV